MAVSLRPVTPGDLATIDRWAAGIGAAAPSRTRPLGDAADRHDPSSGLYWYLVVEDAREVGTVWIERPPGEGRARLGIFLGSPSDFGRGIGQQALRLAIAEFRTAFPDEPIALHVRRSNERAIRCYRGVGFEVVDAGSKASPSGETLAFYTMVCPSQEIPIPPKGSSMARGPRLDSRIARGDLILTEAAVVERMRREFLIPADDHVEYGGAIYDERAAAALRRIYAGYLDVAQRFAMPLLLTSSTRRSNQERLAASRFAGRRVMEDWMTFLRELRGERGDAVFVGGLLGARGDAYRPQEALSRPAARAFHRAQCAALADAGADFLLAATLPALSEAGGLAEAMGETGLPFILSFVIDRTGLLLDGTPLYAAVTAIDDISPPLCYLVNCVHPANVLAGLASDANRDQPALSRVKGIQGNTSTLSPGELDDSAELHCDGAESLVEATVTLRREHAFQIFGGCCGTDETHLEAIAAGLAAGSR